MKKDWEEYPKNDVDATKSQMAEFKAQLLKVGDRVKSISDGFTGGRVGTIDEFGRRGYGGSDSEWAAFIKFDDGGYYAVAVKLLQKLDP